MKKVFIGFLFIFLLTACGDEKTFHFTNYEFTEKFGENAGETVPIGEKIQFDENTYLVEILPTISLQLQTAKQNYVKKAAIIVKKDAFANDTETIKAAFHTLFITVDPSLTESDIKNISTQLGIVDLTLTDLNETITFNDIVYKYESRIKDDFILLEARPK